MGQKIHPKLMRLGIIKDWDSKWYGNKKNYSKNFLEDFKIRNYIKKNLLNVGISRVLIERIGEKISVIIYSGKPGIIIGHRGETIEKTKNNLKKILKKKQINIKVIEIKKNEIEAQIVSENIAIQLEKRISFRRAIKQAIQRAMKEKIKGIKIVVSGRLGGAEIARTEWYREGKVPLHTIRANINYGFSEAITTYGKIGVKTWICLGEILKDTNDKNNFNNIKNIYKNKER